MKMWRIFLHDLKLTRPITQAENQGLENYCSKYHKSAYQSAKKTGYHYKTGYQWSSERKYTRDIWE